MQPSEIMQPSKSLHALTEPPPTKARRDLLRIAFATAGTVALPGCSMVAAPTPRAPAPQASASRAGEDLERVLDAHGGRARWSSVRTIDARLSSGGLALSSRFQGNALKALRIRVTPRERRVELHDYTQTGWRGQWVPERVVLLDTAGRTVAERENPRARFDLLSTSLVWDQLDALYFAGYALWNYLSFPFLLVDPAVMVSLPGADTPGEGRRLIADFAPGFPTHSARQVFHFDDAWHLTRHDYTADVMGTWATAANLTEAAADVDGLRFYTRRRVLPRLGASHAIQSWPLLVWIELDDLTVAHDSPRG